MKKAFTLIELIFVIVIIGVLAAVAVPKFLNLKQHAEANNVIKTTIDGAQQATEAAVNYIDLENDNTFTLQDILKIKGKGWTYVSDGNGSYEFNDTTTNALIAEINLSIPSREVNYSIDCTKFSDSTTQAKCQSVLGSATASENLKF